MPELTAERLREVLDYEPTTGLFRWRQDRWAGRPRSVLRAKAGELAGCLHQKLGYVIMSVDGYKGWAHRMAWLYVHGKWPDGSIDHINGLKADNRIENLRDVSHRRNLENIRSAHKDSKTGFLGVTYDSARNKWQSRIKVNYVTRHLGRFDTPEQAHAAYVEAKRKYHEGCTI